MTGVKQIRNDSELDVALARIGELLHSEPGSPQYDELNVLSDLVRVYEDKHHAIGLPSVAGAIEFYMEQRGLTLDDLAALVGGKRQASEVLSGKRDITIKTARALYKNWGISAEILLQDPGASLVL